MADSKRGVWFGTQNRMEWVRAPLAGNFGRTPSGWGTSGTFLNGGAYVKSSTVGARRFPMSWGELEGSEARKITAYLEGTYGLGPLYMVDPFASKFNALPQWLAVPSLSVDGAPNVLTSVPSTGVTTPANGWAWPSQGATFTYASGVAPWITPVPPNTPVSIAVAGSASGTVLRYNLSGYWADVALASVASQPTTTLVGTTGATGGWLQFQLSGAGSITLYGMIVQFGPAAILERFEKGEGSTGMSLVPGTLQVSGYTAWNDTLGLSADFVEVSPWL